MGLQPLCLGGVAQNTLQSTLKSKLTLSFQCFLIEKSEDALVRAARNVQLSAKDW